MSISAKEALAQRFVKDFRLDQWANSLSDNYMSANRMYHGPHYVTNMLDNLEIVKHRITNVAAVKLAIWFHKAIYEGNQRHNQLKSISLFKSFAKDYKLDSSTKKITMSMIFLTMLETKPEAFEVDNDHKLFLDLVNSIYAGRFVEYSISAYNYERE